MSIIRWLLGRIILLLDWLFTPRSIKRSSEQQQSVNQLTANLALYQYKACPFCVKVRRAMKRAGVDLKTYDAKRNETHKDELLAGGGELKVPCLKIEDENGSAQWMYESSDIIAYIHKKLASNGLAY